MNMYTLIVFAKLPIRGQVKTRIAAQSSDEFAFNLYQHLLSACLLQAQLAAQEFTRVTAIASQVHWHYAGLIEECDDSCNAVVQAFLNKPELMVAQATSSDLGIRMARSLRAYASPCLLMGSDIPTMDSRRLLKALLTVQQYPDSIIYNPTRDGGYCLVGRGLAHAMNEQIFESIAWSTPKVMEQTRLKLLALNMPWRELEPLDDIDDLAAAQRYLTL
jgi:uncharacterized protein